MTTTRGFDLDGRVLVERTTREAGTESTTYTYTTGRLTKITHPGGGFETFTYHDDDTVATHVTRRGLTLTPSYDAANRLTSLVPWKEGVLGDGLAALDAGDATTYDGLDRMTVSGLKTGDGIDPIRRIAFPDLDPRGLPRREQVGTLLGVPAITLERDIDVFGRTTGLDLASGLGPGSALTTITATYDELDRLTGIAGRTEAGQATAGFGAAYTWRGATRLTSIVPAGSLRLHETLGHQAGTGLLEALGYQPENGSSLGGFTLEWDAAAGLKQARRVAPAEAAGSLVARLGMTWVATQSHRLKAATFEPPREPDAPSRRQEPLGSWSFGYGVGDELTSIHDDVLGLTTQTAGRGGRIDGRVPSAANPSTFIPDAEGRRIADDRFTYTWDWRGHLVQVDVTGAPSCGALGATCGVTQYAGHRVTYTYDPLGRLTVRTHWANALGETEDGFRDRQIFIWDGDRLAGQAGLAWDNGVIWRTQMVPGPSGDDAPQIRVETGLRSTPQVNLYALIRDEIGQVVGIAEDVASGSSPPVLARVASTPYGEIHLETGPEVLSLSYDATLIKVGSADQHLPPPVPPATASEYLPGGVRIATTLPLSSASLELGLLLERWPEGGAGWEPVDRNDWAIGRSPSSEDDAEISVMPLAGFRRGDEYRVVVTTGLKDGFNRALHLPSGVPSRGATLAFKAPAAGAIIVKPGVWRLQFDTVQALADTLVEPSSGRSRFPGHLTMLRAGAYTDPVTGLAHQDGRWLDPQTGSFIEPGADTPASRYAYAGSAPHLAGGVPDAIPAMPDYAWVEALRGEGPKLPRRSAFLAHPLETAKSMVRFEELRDAMGSFFDRNAPINERLAGGGVFCVAFLDFGANFLTGGGEGAAIRAVEGAAKDLVTTGVREAGEAGLRELVEGGVRELGEAGARELARAGSKTGFRATSKFARLDRQETVIYGVFDADAERAVYIGQVEAEKGIAARFVEHLRHPMKQHWKAGNFEIRELARGEWTAFEAHAHEMAEITRQGGLSALENIKRPIRPRKFEIYKFLHSRFPVNPFE